MPWSTRKPTAIEIAPDWLKPYCEQYLQKLVDQGYAPATMRTYEGAARLLCEAVARGDRLKDCAQHVTMREVSLVRGNRIGPQVAGDSHIVDLRRSAAPRPPRGRMSGRPKARITALRW